MKPEKIRDVAGTFKKKAEVVKTGAVVWLKSHRKESAAGGIVLMGVLMVWLASGLGGGAVVGQETEETVESAVLGIVESDVVEADAAKADAAALESEKETLPADLPPKLEADQTELLDELSEALAARDYEKGGSMLLANEQKLQYLFYQVLGGKQYLYCDGKLSEELEGVGLVLKKPLSVFYGTLSGGIPDGSGVAVQGIILDGLRYDYSDGVWVDGKLSGQATVGYHYYNGAEGETNQAVERTGVFEDDLMNGTFTYRTINGNGEVTIWEMEAAAGVTKIDDRWIHDEGKKCFYLPSNENDSHTYVLPEDAVEEVRWRNMLLWKE